MLAADFGDAPSPYPTQLEENGAQHGAIGPILGTARTSESDGQPSANALSDAADDGVTWGELRVGQRDGSVIVEVQGAESGAILYAWIDFNRDGSWGGADEQVIAARAVTNGANHFTIQVPHTAASGETYARFRLTTQAALGVIGPASDGEVEDYEIELLPATQSGAVFSARIPIATVRQTLVDVAVADFDGDGRDDIAAMLDPQYYDDTLLYANNGDGNFTSRYLALRGTYLHASDLDQDGDFDLVAGTQWSRNTGASLGAGVELLEFPVGNANPAADLDYDGDLDVLSHIPGHGQGAAYWNENTGNLQFEPHLLPGKSQLENRKGGSLVAIDLDRDGDLDIAGSGSSALGYSGNFVWYENLGGQEYVAHRLPGMNEKVLVADLDGDGDMDLIPNRSAGADTVVLLNDGQASFNSHPISSIGELADIAVLDVDGNGLPDIVGFVRVSNELAVLLNQGSGNFSTTRFPAEGLVTALDLGDVDGDGDLDLVTVSKHPGATSDDWLVGWYENRASVQISTSLHALTEESAEKAQVVIQRRGDLNRELQVEFALGGTATYGVDYQLEGADSVAASRGVVTIPAGVEQVSLQVVPIDDDINELVEIISISLGNGDHSEIEIQITEALTVGDYGDAPAPYPSSASQTGAFHPAIGPLLGNLRFSTSDAVVSDLADADLGDDGVVLGDMHVGQALVELTVEVQDAPAGAFLDAWIDFNGDGDWSDSGERVFFAKPVVDGSNTLFLAVPNTAVAGDTFARFRVSSTGGLQRSGPALDGEVEDYRVSILPSLLSGAELTRTHNIGEVSNYGLQQPLVVDMDLDGDMDIVGLSYTFYHNSTGRIRLYENDGDGSFVTHEIGDGTNLLGAIDIADINGDGLPDIIAGAILLNQGNLRFASGPNQAGIGGLNQAIDFDNDGDIDILHSNVKLAVNRGDGVFDTVNLVSTAELKFLRGVDFDGDGDTDIVTGIHRQGYTWYENNGANNFVQRTITVDQAEPGVSFAVGASILVDLDQDGDIDLLNTYSSSLFWYENTGESQFVTHELRDDLTQDVSAYGTPGSIMVADADGDRDLDILAIRTATSSTPKGAIWLINDGDDTFSARPAIGALAIPPASLGLGDIDGDGDPDVVGAYPASTTPSTYAVGWYENRPHIAVSPSQQWLAENSSSLSTITLVRTGNIQEELTVRLQISGTASLGEDYTLTGLQDVVGQSAVVVFPAGVTTIDVRLASVDDSLDEVAETIVLTVQDTDEYAATGDRRATLTLVSDETTGDYGDAPMAGMTTQSEGGAFHLAVGPRLGNDRSSESDATTANNADTDSGDDGVIFGQLQIGQGRGDVTIDVQNAPDGARVDGWIDFNGDGSWSGPHEHIFDSVAVTEGLNVLSFAMPLGVVADSVYARIRLSSGGNLLPNGFASDGEVQDYSVPLEAPIRSGGVFEASSPISEDQAAFNGLAPADIDGDGDVDLFATASAGISWYENDGEGNFTAHPIYTPVSFNPRQIHAADLDNDGDVDAVLYISQSHTSPDSKVLWLENRGEAGFEVHELLATDYHQDGHLVNGIDLADLDSNGFLDIIVRFGGVTPSGFGSLAGLFNKGGHQFQLAELIPLAAMRDLDLVDYDHDGDVDIVTLENIGEAHFSGLVLRENGGNLEFQEHYLATTDDASVLEVVDLDRDGDYDYLLGGDELKLYERMNAELIRHVLWVDPRPQSPGRLGISELAVQDLNGDSLLDIVVGGNGTFSLSLVDQVSNLDFTPRTLLYGTSVYGRAAVADLDGDGDLDAVANHSTNGAPVWFRNQAAVSVHTSGPTVPISDDQGLVLDFQRIGDLQQPVTVSFRLASDAVFGVDYTLDGVEDFDGTTGTVFMPAGATTAQVRLLPVDDGSLRAEQTFIATLLDGELYGLSRHAEVQFSIFSGDFGDAPTPYPTTYDQDGPRHVGRGPYLGLARGNATDGIPGEQAISDQADDGVSFGVLRVGDVNATVELQVTNAPEGARVDAWIDFNQDGVWDSASERVLTSVEVVEGLNRLSLAIPPTAEGGDTFARFRITSEGGVGVKGTAPNGEVEDYIVTLAAPRSEEYFVFGETQDPIFRSQTVGTVVGTEVLDFDGDGDNDVIIADSTSRQVIWFEHITPEYFVPHIVASATGRPTAIAVVDMDLDGNMDIVTSWDGVDARVVWYEPLGENSFRSHLVAELDASASTLAVGDVDRDDDIDIVVGLGVRGTVQWFQNNGQEEFEEHTVTAAYPGVSKVRTSDVDQDGLLDVLVAASGISTIAWFKGVGSGSFEEHVVSRDTQSASSVRAVDLDSDGDVDLVGTSRSGSKVEWFENDGTQTFVRHIIPVTVFQPHDATAKDYDGDGDVDILVGSTSASRFLILVNDGMQGFAAKDVIADTEYSDSFALEDINQDGKLDIIVTTNWPGSEKRLSWYENGAYSMFPRHSISGSKYPLLYHRSLDFDHDGDVDVIAADTSTDEVFLFENDADQNFRRRLLAQLGDAAVEPEIVDVDGDGDYDLIAIGTFKRLVWLENVGDGSSVEHTITTFSSQFNSSYGVSITAGDLDADGNTDIAVAVNVLDAVYIYTNNGTEQFTQSTALNVRRPHGLYIVDLDRDGDLDLSTASQYDRELLVFENLGTGDYARRRIAVATSTPLLEAVTDVDQDGDLDLVASVGKNLAWYSQASPWEFVNHSLELPQFIDGIAMADLDGDGDSDFLPAWNDASPAAMWVENRGGGVLAQRQLGVSLTQLAEWDIVDVNQDGVLDVLYVSSSELTIGWLTQTLLAGDFDANGIVNEQDYARWKQDFGQSGGSLAADGNRNGLVDMADYSVWRDNLGAAVGSPRLPGDYNRDGTVNEGDYHVWRQQFGRKGIEGASDGNRDGVVNLADYTIWRDNLRITNNNATEGESLGSIEKTAGPAEDGVLILANRLDPPATLSSDEMTPLPSRNTQDSSPQQSQQAHRSESVAGRTARNLAYAKYEPAPSYRSGYSGQNVGKPASAPAVDAAILLLVNTSAVPGPYLRHQSIGPSLFAERNQEIERVESGKQIIPAQIHPVSDFITFGEDEFL